MEKASRWQRDLIRAANEYKEHLDQVASFVAGKLLRDLDDVLAPGPVEPVTDDLRDTILSRSRKVLEMASEEAKPMLEEAAKELYASGKRMGLADIQKQDMGIAFDEADRAAREFSFLRPGEEEKLAQFQNRSFAGSWGYNPNTPEMIKYRLSLGHRSPRDVVMAYEGDMLNGYCWTEVVREGEGRIYMIGTDPDYRGQGLGRKLLLAGLSRLKSKGVKIVWLVVDSANETACALYNSVGFRRHTSYLWYEKAVV